MGRNHKTITQTKEVTPMHHKLRRMTPTIRAILAVAAIPILAAAGAAWPTNNSEPLQPDTTITPAIHGPLALP
jgi:hypothetical protein